jgi:hypothetical protein
MDDVEVVAEGKVLIHNFNSQRSGIARPMDVNFFTFKEVVTFFCLINTSYAFDEGALTGSVISDECGDLASICIEIYASKNMDWSKGFIEVAEGEKRFTHVGSNVRASYGNTSFVVRI